MISLFEFYYGKPKHDSRANLGVTSLSDKSLGLTVGDARPMYYNNIVAQDEEESEEVTVDDDDIDAVSRKLKVQNSIIDPKRSDLSNISRYTLKELMRPTGAPITGDVADFSYKTTGNFRHIGTHYGLSRAPIDKEDDNILTFDDELVDDPMERSFKKHQRLLKKMRQKLKHLK